MREKYEYITAVLLLFGEQTIDLFAT